ncbi:MAG: DUF86 domain-containing protein [Anaerolineales bacterium]|nr:DUF86 domain-containing protein [Anaerolineales bacterium]
MDPEERIFAYLWDMREAARLITQFLQGVTFARFESDVMMQSAVERQLEIIGEAARQVSPEFQQHIRKSPGAALSASGIFLSMTMAV